MSATKNFYHEQICIGLHGSMYSEPKEQCETAKKLAKEKEQNDSTTNRISKD